MTEQMQPMPDVPERCPKCGETERHYWCRCGTLIKGTVCPMCGRTREEAMKRGHAGDPIPLACGTEITPDGRVIREGEMCLRRQLAQAQAEVERLRQAVDALQLDRRTLEDVISVLEQEQRRAGRYLEDARDELAHGRIQSAEHRIIDALVSLSSKERRTDTRLKTVVKSGGATDGS